MRKVSLEELKKSEEFKTLPDIKSTDVQWMKWVDLIERKYGPHLAKQNFLAAWNKRGSQAANTIAFRKHIKDKYNLEIDESVWNKIADFGGGVADTFGKAFKVGKITLYIAGAIIVVVVLKTAYDAAKGVSSPLKLVKK